MFKSDKMNCITDTNTDKAIDADKAEQAIKAYNEYMNARELTKQAIEQNKNDIDKSEEALATYNKNDPESKAYLDKLFENIRLSSEALYEAIAKEGKAKIHCDKMANDALS